MPQTAFRIIFYCAGEQKSCFWPACYCLCDAHTHDQQQKCSKPARARRLCHSGMTRSDGEVSAGTPQGSDSGNGWEDETLAALHLQDLDHFMTLPKPSPWDRRSPSFRYKLLVLSWLVGIPLFCVTFTLLHVCLECLHVDFLPASWQKANHRPKVSKSHKSNIIYSLKSLNLKF